MARPLRIEYPGAFYHGLGTGRRRFGPEFFFSKDVFPFFQIKQQ